MPCSLGQGEALWATSVFSSLSPVLSLSKCMCVVCVCLSVCLSHSQPKTHFKAHKSWSLPSLDRIWKLHPKAGESLVQWQATL